MTPTLSHAIPPDTARTLPRLLCERARRTPDDVAYRWFDATTQTWRDISWRAVVAEVSRWRAALTNDGLRRGDAVGIMLANGCEWIFMEQAALSLGLVVVPLFTNDRAENVGYILDDARVRLLLLRGDESLKQLTEIRAQLENLPRIVSVNACGDARLANTRVTGDWLPAGAAPEYTPVDADPDALATIVYTSGTTGRPKGVMLSHKNILSNAWGGINLVPVDAHDLFLSFLPLSHMLERTLGYYIPMMGGATVAFARSVPQLAEDLRTIRPTVLISVPRIYERVQRRIEDQLAAKSAFARALFAAAVGVGWYRFEYTQGRVPWHPKLLLWPLFDALVARKLMAQLGGRLRVAICGGAPLSRTVARTFLGLGLNLIQGYGLTETGPIVSGNPPADNLPDSVGVPLLGIDVKLGEQGELLTRSASVMRGYWNNPDATRKIIDADGWLHTGDLARIERNHIFITGRLKDILVLANGEKVAPADMELAIAGDGLFEHVLVIGEGKPYLVVLAGLNPDAWRCCAADLKTDWVPGAGPTPKAVEDYLCARIAKRTAAFPGYAQVRRVGVTHEPWTIENGLVTSTLKMRRAQIVEHFATLVQSLYAGH